MGSKYIRNITKIFRSASGVLFGRVSASTGRGEELTPSQVRSLLSVYTVTQTDAAISTAVNTLIGGAPGLLDTLDELSAALGDDANFASTVTSALSGKVDAASLSESIDDRVAALLVAGTNITLTYNDASNTLTVASSGGGIASINSLSGASQAIAVGTSGTDFAIVSIGTSHTLNLPDASATARGVVTTGTQTIAGQKTLSGILSVGPSAGTKYPLNVGSTSFFAPIDSNTAAAFYNAVYAVNNCTVRIVSGAVGIAALDLGNYSSSYVRLQASASGVAELNNGTTGTFADLKLRTVCVGPFTVGTLPSASANDGATARVTDSNVAASGNYGAVVAGGGANKIRVFSNGTNWIIA